MSDPQAWVKVGKAVFKAWPSQPWPTDSVEWLAEVWEDKPASVFLAAINEIAEQGREFAPSPSVVLAEAKRVWAILEDNRAMLAKYPSLVEDVSVGVPMLAYEHKVLGSDGERLLIGSGEGS